MRRGRGRLALLLAAGPAVAAGAHPQRPALRRLLLQDASLQNVSQMLVDCESEVHGLQHLLQACQDNLTAQEEHYRAELGDASSALDHFMQARGAVDALQAEVAQKQGQLAQVEQELESLSAQLLDTVSAAKRRLAASLLHAGALRVARADRQSGDWLDEIFADMLLECREGEKDVAQSEQLCQANYKAEASRLAARLATRRTVSASADSAAGMTEEQLAILSARLVAAEGRRDRLRARLQEVSEAMAS